MARRAVGSISGSGQSFARPCAAPTGRVLAVRVAAVSEGLSIPVVWSERQRMHEPDAEIWAGVRTPAAELPERAERIRAELEVPPDAPRFLLMLDSPDVEELPEYRLEIRTSLGEDVWEAKGLTLNEDGRFVVGLSRGFLPAGEYNIYVFGVIQGSEGLIQDYRVRFSYL